MADRKYDMYSCYYCSKGSNNCDAILSHSLIEHAHLIKSYSMRKLSLNEETGRHVYRSVHFDASFRHLLNQQQRGLIPHITGNDGALKLIYERTLDPKTAESATQSEHADIYELLHAVIEQMKTIGRLCDFKSVLSAIASGILLENICFHLLLDIGRFYSTTSIDTMRYPESTLQFWVTVKHLFKGKGLNFFRAFKGKGMREEGSSTVIGPTSCRINFVVPADSILNKECSRFVADAKKPGVLSSSLDVFAKQNSGKDVKLSIDGKKLATGLGKLGDEDLCGHEREPTLIQRRKIHTEEVETVENIKNQFEERAMDGYASLADFPEHDLHAVKEPLLRTITNISQKIKALRELIINRNLALQKLLQQVDGDWRQSKLAPAISFSKTKIVHAKAAIKDLLNSVDNIGSIVAFINGTGDSFISGQGPVHFDMQPNYTCLREISGSPESQIPPYMIKQGSTKWHSLRQTSRITGSTMFKALGMERLRDQQEHHDKVFSNKTVTFSEETLKKFEYGSTNEINALATLLGKILPVYFPELSFREDGCKVLALGQSYMVVSGDGSGLNAKGETKVAFEFKCPIPGKQRTTDVHYLLPTRYVTQVMSQMAAKGSESFCYVSYSPESATFIRGKHDDALWVELFNKAELLYGSDTAWRPTKTQPDQKETLLKLKKYAEMCSFEAEFSSLTGIKCSCESADVPGSEVFGNHQCLRNQDQTLELVTLDSSAAILDRAVSALREAYEILRRPAKDILVTVISDLDRTHHTGDTTHLAVPAQYALSGYSLPMGPVRCLLNDAIESVESLNMSVKVVAFDGQFLELSVADEDGRPLTICRFMKYYWEYVQKLPKADKLKSLLHCNDIPSIKGTDELNEVFRIQVQGHSCTIELNNKSICTHDQPFNQFRKISKQENKQYYCFNRRFSHFGN